MPDPVPLGLQKPTLPSTSQRRETLWAYGSHHFPQSGCTTGSIHPDVSTQPCPLSPSQPSVTGLDTSPPLLPPSLTLCSPPKPTRTCPHHGQGPARARHWTGATSVLLLLGGSAADPPTHRPHRSPWLPASQTRAAHRLCLHAGVPQGLVLGPSPSPQVHPRGSSDHSQSDTLSPHGLPIPLASRPNLTAALDGTHPPGGPYVSTSQPAP